MYSLTFRVRVTTPPHYGRNGTAHAAGASILSPARGVFAGMRSACSVRWACWITAGLCHAFPQCCHSNATCEPIANPPNRAQLGGIPYHSPKLRPGPSNSVCIRPRSNEELQYHTNRHVLKYPLRVDCRCCWTLFNSITETIEIKEKLQSVNARLFHTLSDINTMKFGTLLT